MVKLSSKLIFISLVCLAGCSPSVDQTEAQKLSPETIRLVELYSFAEAIGPLQLDDPLIQEISNLTGKKRFRIGTTIYDLEHLPRLLREECLKVYNDKADENGGELKKADIEQKCVDPLIRGIEFYGLDIRIVD